MKRKTSKILSVLLALVMMFSLVPTAAAADCTHSSDDWESNAVQHWKKCDECGDEFGHENHGQWGEWEIEVDPTCGETGKRVHLCGVCGYPVSETIAKLEDHSRPSGKDAFGKGKVGHSYTCTVCGQEQVEDHEWDSDGSTCEICGYVKPAESVTGVSLDRTSLSLEVNKTYTLALTFKPDDASNKNVTWKSSNDSVATVDKNGKVTAIAAGTARITVTTEDGGKTAYCDVTVTSTTSTTNGVTYPRSVTISSTSRSEYVSISLTEQAAAYYAYDNVSWSLSSNNSYISLCRTDSTTNSAWGSTAVTPFERYGSEYRTGVYIRSNYLYSGNVTLYARLYNRSTNKYTDIPITVYTGYTTSSDFTLTPSPSTSSSIYLYDGYRYDWDYDHRWDYNYRSYQDFSVVPMYKGNYVNSTEYTVTYNWYVNNTPYSSSSYNKNTFRLNAYDTSLNRTRNTVTCRAYIYTKGTNTQLATTAVEWGNIYTDYYQTSSFTASATVYDTTSKYNLNDKDDKNGSSIISQIADKLYNYNYSYGSYGRDYISYVRFSNVTSSYGSLNASTSRDYYYDSYRSGSYDLRDVEFTPSKTGTASFDCTVYSTQGYSYKCTINIKVEAGTTDKTASTIYYNTTGTKSVTLSASDFTSRYKDVVGSSASTLTIRFRSVPSNGTLKYNNTTLTSSNISSYDFSSSSSGSYRISDLTYTPKNNSDSSDTVDYYCYSGSTRRFSGSIKFTNKKEDTTPAVPTGISVSYSTTGASVTFSAPDFYNKHSAMLSASYIVFGSPTSGTLSSGGSAVASGTKFGYTVDTSKGYKNLASVSYKPASGYNGTATIPFTAYNSDGTQAATGSVSILVSQTTTTTTPTNTAKTFKDVSSTAWYYNDVAELAAAGIVNGDTDGKFRPNDAVNYGEALKMVLIAAGYDKQAEPSGSNWAQNYLNLAISNSILSGSAGDYSLNKSITRTAMATVAAKALKLTPVTSSASSPYTDTKDSYVLALTNTGIVQGETTSNGQKKWRGDDTLTRAEMSRIVYNIYKYRNVAPGGSSANPNFDSVKPDGI